jgi:hypothetical protein
MSGHESAHNAQCLNCGEPLAGPYCSRCGQHDVDYHRSIGPIVEDTLQEFLNFDGKFFKSVRYLFTRPGFLTREFIAGRRVRYAHPLRFYVFASFLFFATSALTAHKATPAEAAAAKLEAQKAETEASADAKAAQDELKEAGLDIPAANKALEGVRAAEVTPTPTGGIEVSETNDQNGRSRNRTIRAFLNSEGHIDRMALGNEMIHLLPEMLFFCLPVLALILKVVDRRSGRFYVEHLIFALHIQAFAFLAMLAGLAVAALTRLVDPGAESLVTTALFIGSVVLAYHAFKNVYGQAGKRNRLRFVLVAGVYGIFLIQALLALVAVSVYLVSRGA